MLVIPAIEIKNYRCLRTVARGAQTQEDLYPTDPAEVALMWRRENAKTLHVSDYDGLYGGSMDNFDAVITLVRRVEIPIGLLARFATSEECRQWLEGGVYRLIVHDLIQHDPDGVAALVEQFGASRIIAGAITRGGKTCSTWRDIESLDAVDFAHRARSLGIRRLFFTDRDYEGVLRGPNYEQIRRVATESSMPVTAAGGVASVEHLWMLQEMEILGVDSVVIGRAFYENLFPCQQLWRDVELEQMRNGTAEDVSTSRLTSGEKGAGSEA